MVGIRLINGRRKRITPVLSGLPVDRSQGVGTVCDPMHERVLRGSAARVATKAGAARGMRGAARRSQGPPSRAET